MITTRRSEINMSIQKFLNEKIDDNMPVERMVQIYISEKDMSIERFLGKGHFGEAYLTTDEKVIKVTKDAREAYAALKVEGMCNENVVTIFNVEQLTDKYFVIEQEFTNHDSNADELYWELSSVVDNNGFEDINELLSSDILGDLVIDDNLMDVINQLKNAESFMLKLGIKCGGLDMQADNFSYVDGKIKTFDNIASYLKQQDARELIKKEFNISPQDKSENKIKP
jgi:hypothetical protein